MSYSPKVKMYLCILLLPFLSFLTTNLTGRFVGGYGSNFIAPVSILTTLFLSFFAFYESFIAMSCCTVSLFSWFTTDLFVCDWAFLFDSITVVMLLVVTGVSSLVHIYSTEYMANDPHRARFLGYLSLFTFFMLVLVTADNFIIMFLGWEGIGLASFLLISFWFNRIKTGKAAIKAMIVNRVGDVGLALAIALVFLTFKTVDYQIVFALAPSAVELDCTLMGITLDRLSVITFLLFFGAVGKSAQIGLHIWLPDAMEGPTPVSALIHAATLVTAGVFLIIRCSSLFELSSNTLVIVATMGSLTCFFAASVGLVQNDLKRVIAYSTCSQLGYMVFACGLSNYSLALFHLANHAIFKALLFLSAGCIIHGLCDEQDLRRYGGVIELFPLSYIMILIGSMALTGFPFLTGFYSKDVILEIAATKQTSVARFAHTLGCLAAFCTSFYSFRLLFLTFVNKTNSYRAYILKAHEAPIRMSLPLMFLGLGSIFAGFFGRDAFIGFGSPAFVSSISVNAENLVLIDSEFISPWLKNLPLMFTLLGAFLAWTITYCGSLPEGFKAFETKQSLLWRTIIVFLAKKWHFDQLINGLIAQRSLNFGYHVSFRLLDKGVIETFGPVGIVSALFRIANTVSKFQAGYIHQQFLTLIVGLIAIVSIISIFLIDCDYVFGNFSLLLLALCQTVYVVSEAKD